MRIRHDWAAPLFEQRHIERDAELRRNDGLFPIGRERRTDETLIVMRIVGRTVDLRRIEMSDPHVDCRGNQRMHLLLICGRTVRMAHPHAPKPY